MEQEGGVHSLPHHIVAAERKRQIADATRYFCSRTGLFDNSGSFYESNSVFVMFLNTGCNSENIRVEYDVSRVETHLLRQNSIGALTNLHLSLQCIGLPLFVEGHHHHGSAEAATYLRLVDKRFFSFLQRNRVDNTFPLQAFQTCFDHAEFGGVNHHRYPGNIGLG